MGKSLSSGLGIVSLPVIVFLAGLGWIYSGFPEQWFEPVSFCYLVSTTVSLLYHGADLVLNFPFLNILVLVVSFFAILRKPCKARRRHLFLLVPQSYCLLVAAWGAYWTIRPMGFPDLSRKLTWYENTILEVTVMAILSTFVVGLFVMFGKAWKGERTFGVSTLFIQFIYFIGVLFFSALGASHAPL